MDSGKLKVTTLRQYDARWAVFGKSPLQDTEVVYIFAFCQNDLAHYLGPQLVEQYQDTIYTTIGISNHGLGHVMPIAQLLLPCSTCDMQGWL